MMKPIQIHEPWNFSCELEKCHRGFVRVTESFIVIASMFRLSKSYCCHKQKYVVSISFPSIQKG